MIAAVPFCVIYTVVKPVGFCTTGWLLPPRTRSFLLYVFIFIMIYYSVFVFTLETREFNAAQLSAKLIFGGLVMGAWLRYHLIDY